MCDILRRKMIIVSRDLKQKQKLYYLFQHFPSKFQLCNVKLDLVQKCVKLRSVEDLRCMWRISQTAPHNRQICHIEITLCTSLHRDMVIRYKGNARLRGFNAFFLYNMCLCCSEDLLQVTVERDFLFASLQSIQCAFISNVLTIYCQFLMHNFCRLSIYHNS